MQDTPLRNHVESVEWLVDTASHMNGTSVLGLHRAATGPPTEVVPEARVISYTLIAVRTMVANVFRYHHLPLFGHGDLVSVSRQGTQVERTPL
jgi:hypothetical protein